MPSPSFLPARALAVSAIQVFRSAYDRDAAGEVDDDGTVWSIGSVLFRTEIGRVDQYGCVYTRNADGVALANVSSSGAIARGIRSFDVEANIDLGTGVVSGVGGGGIGRVDLPAPIDDGAVLRAGGAVALLLLHPEGSREGGPSGDAGDYTSSLIAFGAGLLFDLAVARIEQNRIARRASESARLGLIADTVQKAFLSALRAEALAVRASARFLQPALAGSDAGSFVESTACLWLDLAVVRAVAAESASADDAAAAAAGEAAGTAFAGSAHELRGITTRLRRTWAEAESARTAVLQRAFAAAAGIEGLNGLLGLSVVRIAHEQVQAELPGLVGVGSQVAEAGSGLSGARSRHEWLGLLEELHRLRLRLRWTGLRLTSFLEPISQADTADIQEVASSTAGACTQAAQSALHLEGEVVRWITAMSDKLESQMPGESATPELAALDRYVSEV